MQNIALTKQRPSLAALQSLEDIQAMRPEWLRIPAACRISGLSRTQIFYALASKAIESRHLKRPGAKKGIRLIRLSSLLAYIDGMEG